MNTTSDLQACIVEQQRTIAELRQLTNTTAHELQAPINNASGSIELLRARLGDTQDHETLEYLQLAQLSISRMQLLVSGLLDVAEIQHASPELVQAVDLRVVVDIACSVLRTELDRTNAELHIDDRLPAVPGDQAQLERLFVNLLSNAIKYRDPGRALQIHVDVIDSGEQWQIKVTDNGVGIDPSLQHKAFEPFERLHRTDDIPGTGLGLGICRQIMNNHKGTITITAGPKLGCTVLLRLPKTSDRPVGVPTLIAAHGASEPVVRDRAFSSITKPH